MNKYKTKVVSMAGTRVGGGYYRRCCLLEQQPLNRFGEIKRSYRVTAHWENEWEGAESMLTVMRRSAGETDLTTRFPDVENGGSKVIVMVAGP